MSFFGIGEFECYDANVIMCDRVGKYGLEGNAWIVVQHEEMKKS